jgi:hypothetical protein
MASFDWTKLLDVGGIVDTAASVTPASIPFMITRAQRARLQELGYSEETISTMTPEEAHRFLGS